MKKPIARKNIHEWKDRNGKTKTYLSKQWPDGSRIRQVMPSLTVAMKTLARIEESIAMGTWKDLKEELAADRNMINPTIKEFKDDYLEKYCRVYNRRPDFKEQAFKSICRHVGSIRLRDFTSRHAEAFVASRLKEVGSATVNRGLAVLKNLFTYALKRGLVKKNPLAGFELLQEIERGLRILTYTEYRSLAAGVAAADPVVGAMVIVCGETGIRRSEALRITWDDVDFGARRLSVRGPTKSGKSRPIPLSELAVRTLAAMVRVLHCPHVFVRAETGTVWKEPRGPFEQGRTAAALSWVRGFHDLRHFRATQWLMHGMDVRTVQRLLGHANLSTTERYTHYVDEHARAALARVEAVELEEFAKKDVRRVEAAERSKTNLDDSWTISK